jgi:hypothetical protein
MTADQWRISRLGGGGGGDDDDDDIAGTTVVCAPGQAFDDDGRCYIGVWR